jgi:hypothetical protein
VTSTLLILLVAVIVVLGLLGTGLLVLIKLGVLAKYVFKEEPPDHADYELDQSHEAGEQ